jgi:hypothetical protein
MITISMFEKHAGSTAHHPSDYIILKNGNSLRKIVDNCQHAAHCQQNVLDSLKRAIGYVPTNRTSNNAAAAAACHKCGLWNGVALLSCSQAKCKYAYHPGTSQDLEFHDRPNNELHLFSHFERVFALKIQVNGPSSFTGAHTFK